jgi:hypothetical protein
MSLAAIMTSPDFGEICFLVAFILFTIEFVIRVMRPANWAYDSVLLAAGLAFVALGFLAL